jgi:hypothetical protein
MGEGDPAGSVQGDGLDGPGLFTAVAGVAGAAADRDLRPGQGLELLEQFGLVALCLQEQMCSAGGDLLGVIGLGVQGVGDEHDPGQAAQYFFDGVEQRCGGGDLVAFVSTVTWARMMPVLVSRADSRCVWRPPGRRAPRSVLPSMAITVR